MILAIIIIILTSTKHPIFSNTYYYNRLAKGFHNKLKSIVAMYYNIIILYYHAPLSDPFLNSMTLYIVHDKLHEMH